MKNFILTGIAAALVICFLFSCKKSNTPEPDAPQIIPAKGAYVLSEGSFNGNNTKLAYYSAASNSITGDFFGQQNPSQQGLGDTGNDMIIYGSKMYIVVNVSGRVVVLNAATGAYLQSISFLIGGANKQPRFAASGKGKVFISAWDGTVKTIDTTTLAITGSVNVGPNPEGLVVAGDYLYVANSGGLNPVPDSTVSVINLNSNTEVRRVKVGVNPYLVAATSDGKIFVSAYGDFASKPASISVINGSSATTSTNLGAAYPYSNVFIDGTTAYFYNNYTAPAPLAKIKVYNTSTNAVVRNEFITDGTSVTDTYGLDVDITGDVYVSDAGNFSTSGKIFIFNSAGVKKAEFSTAPGINPKKFAFNR